MRIGVIIPDRGDRPEFMDNCEDMLNRQTLQPHLVRIIDYKPVSDLCDITARYRMGYEAMTHDCTMSARKVDVIAFIENDDWYSRHYLQYMADEWVKAGKPDLFGTDYTIYYHLKERAHFIMHHSERASAMNTFIKPNLNFEWCPNHDPFTDQHLWMKDHGMTKKIIKPQRIISVGMKHGVGLCGGRSHVDKLHRFKHKDDDMSWLKSTIDKESFYFYRSVSEKLNND